MNGEGEEAGGESDGRDWSAQRGRNEGLNSRWGQACELREEARGSEGSVPPRRDDHLQGSVVQADSERRTQLEELTIDVLQRPGWLRFDTDLSRLLGAGADAERHLHQIPEYDGSLYRTEGADEDEVESSAKVCLGSV